MSAFSKDVEFRGSIWISQRDEIFSNEVLLFLCTYAGGRNFGVGDFWLETRVIIKISSHP